MGKTLRDVHIACSLTKTRDIFLYKFLIYIYYLLTYLFNWTVRFQSASTLPSRGIYSKHASCSWKHRIMVLSMYTSLSPLPTSVNFRIKNSLDWNISFHPSRRDRTAPCTFGYGNLGR